MNSATLKRDRVSVSVVFAWLLCAVLLWSFFGGSHQLFVPHRTTLQDFDIVVAFMWFCPAFVLLIFRTSRFVVTAYAVPIIVLLVARIYFFWRLEALGTNVVNEYMYWVLGPQYFLMLVSFLILVGWGVWKSFVLFLRYSHGGK